MNFEKIVDVILNKEPIFYVSNNIDEIKREKEIIENKLDEFYVDGYIDESFYRDATKIVDDTYHSQIQNFMNDIEASNLRFGMAYVRDLTGSYPSIYNGISGTLGENPSDAKLTINYKTIDDINAERAQSISLLYEQYTSGKISDEVLQEKEAMINFVYDNLVQSLPKNQSKKI